MTPQLTLKDKLPTSGRDEMNLAEFAIGLASDRNTRKINTIERTQTRLLANGDRVEQSWTVTGSDKHGLPRAADDDVFLALLKIATDQGMKERQINFTRYEVLSLLDWPKNGRSYQRFEESLERLAGVRILAKNSFWDSSRKSYTSLNFGLLDDYILVNGLATPSQTETPCTQVTFNEKFFRSMQVGNMKKLDLDFYKQLGTTVAKRLYRYLDKRRYRTPVLDVELIALATVNLGLDLSTRRFASQIKQMLDPAHEELKKLNFLTSWSYRLSGERECWFVQYRFASSTVLRLAEEPAVSEDLKKLLQQRGFSAKLAAQLVKDFPERISAKVDMYDQLTLAKSPQLARNALGWLRKAIEDDYQQVTGYEPPETRQRKRQNAETLRAEQLSLEKQSQAQSDQTWSIFQALPEGERREMVEQAKLGFRFLAPDKLRSLQEESPMLRAAIITLLQEQRLSRAEGPDQG